MSCRNFSAERRWKDACASYASRLLAHIDSKEKVEILLCPGDRAAEDMSIEQDDEDNEDEL